MKIVDGSMHQNWPRDRKLNDTVDGRRIFGVVFPILKGRQLRIHHSDSKWFFVHKPNIGHSNNYGPNGPNRNEMGSNY